MASQSHIRSHSGHGGHHHHAHDNTYLVSSNKADAGVRITRIGLFVNLAMAIGKGIGGYVFHSQSLSADAIHSLTDLVSDFMTLATVSWALKPPTEKYPLGFGKVESLGSLGVSGLLLLGGIYMGCSALIDLLTTFYPAIIETLQQLHMIGHGHSHSHTIPDIQAAWIAGGSVIVKEWLYRATMKVAKQRKSAVLESNAIHHRVDSLTGIVALATIAISNIVPSLSSLDAFGGLLISWMVIRAGWTNTKTSLTELADASVADDVKETVKSVTSKALREALHGAGETREVSGTKAGQNYLLDIEVAVPNDLTIEQLSGAESLIRERVATKVRGSRRIRIRFVPLEAQEGDFMHDFVPPGFSTLSTPEPEKLEHELNEDNALTSHDHLKENGHHNGNIKKDL